MAFSFYITERAELNIDDAIDWYELKSENCFSFQYFKKSLKETI